MDGEGDNICLSKQQLKQMIKDIDKSINKSKSEICAIREERERERCCIIVIVCNSQEKLEEMTSEGGIERSTLTI